MKNSLSMLLGFTFLSFHCQSQRSDKDFNSFDFYTNSKAVLKENGFKSINIMSEGNDPETWYKKVIGDTILQFHFDGNRGRNVGTIPSSSKITEN